MTIAVASRLDAVVPVPEVPSPDPDIRDSIVQDFQDKIS